MVAESYMSMDKHDWRAIVARYAHPDRTRGLWQVVNTLIPFVALFYLSLRLIEVSFWLAFPVQALAGGFLIRTFIIFHDCGHGSFFASRKAKDIVGFLTGVLTLTPYQHWRDEHARHHATAGDLDRRGLGD